MPTDVIAALARKRAADRQVRATIGVLCTCLIICLINVVLLFISPRLARAFDLWESPGPACMHTAHCRGEVGSHQ